MRRRTRRLTATVLLTTTATLLAVLLFTAAIIQAEEPQEPAVTGHHALYVEKAVNGDWLITDGLVINWRASNLWDITVAFDGGFTRRRAGGLPNHAFNDWDLSATYHAPWAWLKGGWVTLGYRWRWWIEGNDAGQPPGVESWNYLELAWGW